MKKLVFLGLALMVLVFFCSSIYAGGFAAGETTSILKGMFGFNGLVGGNGAPPSFSPVLSISGDSAEVGEIYGQTDFARGPGSNIAGIYISKMITKNSAVRLSRFTVISDTSEARISGQDILTNFTVHSTELAYTRQMNRDFCLGLSLAPESVNVDYQTRDGFNKVQSSVKPTWNYRLGVNQNIGGWINLYLVYGQDDFKVNQKVNNVDWPTTSYRQKTMVVGMSITSLLTITRESRSLKGTGVNQTQNFWGYNLVWPVSNHLFVSLTERDRKIFGLQYSTDKWNAGLAFSHNDYRLSPEALGTGSSTYVWLGQTF